MSNIGFMSELETSFATKSSDDVNIQMKAPLFCDICKVLCNSPFVFETHLKGQKHARKRKNLQVVDAQSDYAATPPKMFKPEVNVISSDVLQKIHVLANYHEINVRYTTVSADGFDDERFEVKMELGDECYFAKGPSIKRAQQFAAALALKETRYAKVTEKMLHQKKKKRRQSKKILFYPPSKFAENFQFKEIVSSDESSLCPELCSSVNSRLNDIIPSQERIDQINKAVAEIEVALKTASDDLAEEYAVELNDVSIPFSLSFKFGRLPVISFPDDAKSKYRMIQYIVRVGNYYKNLLRADDNVVDFVLICQRQPTEKFLDELIAMLYSSTNPDNFEVEKEHSVVVIKALKSELQLRLTLTSLLISTEVIDGLEPEQKELLELQCKTPPGVLPVKLCVDALNEIAHASWFHQHLLKLPAAQNAIRLFADLRLKYPNSMGLMPQWFYEVLVENSLDYSMMRKIPTYVLFRNSLEILASGRLLPGGISLYDPCSKSFDNFSKILTNEQLESLTETAQKCVLLISQGKSNELFKRCT